MFSINEIQYATMLRAKPGELNALRRLWMPNKHLTLPILVLPALPARDPIKKRQLTKREAPQLYAKRIAESWKSFPFLLEPRFLKFDVDPEDDAEHVSKLLRYAEKAECRAIPTIDVRTSENRLKVFADYLSRTESGIAFRCSLADISRRGLEDRILQNLQFIGVKISHAVLLIDLSDAALLGVSEVAGLIIQSYSRLPK